MNHREANDDDVNAFCKPNLMGKIGVFEGNESVTLRSISYERQGDILCAFLQLGCGVVLFLVFMLWF